MELERRRPGHIRFPMRVPALAEESMPDGSTCPGLTKNLSRSGMLLLLREEAKPGTSIRVTMRLRHRISLTLTGTVMWVRPSLDSGWEMGFQFAEELSQDLVATIADEEFSPWAAGSSKTLATVH